MHAHCAFPPRGWQYVLLLHMQLKAHILRGLIDFQALEQAFYRHF